MLPYTKVNWAALLGSAKGDEKNSIRYNKKLPLMIITQATLSVPYWDSGYTRMKAVQIDMNAVAEVELSAWWLVAINTGSMECSTTSALIEIGDEPSRV